MSLILITGGARAGKSTFAEQLARQLGEDRVCYVATAQALDEEMTARIAAHRARRPAAWITVESPRRVAANLAGLHGFTPPLRVVLVDCLTMLVSNVLLSHHEPVELESLWQDIQAEVNGLIQFARQSEATVVLVTNEVGWGIVPETKLCRWFQDLLGRANQRMAAAADDVYLVVAGIPVGVKSTTRDKREGRS